MGFLSGLKKVTYSFVDFRVDQWLDYPNIKKRFSYLINQTKNLFTVVQPQKQETFKQAMLRFELSDGELATQANNYRNLSILFLSSATLMLFYLLFLVFIKQNYMGACITFSLTIYSLTRAYYYHFWYFQIKKEKLGCSPKEWFLALIKRDINKDIK